MANEEHVALLRSGVASWNAWRHEVHMEPDLSGADLAGLNLSGADLFHALLADARLAGAHLAGAQLFGTDLARADLARADLTGTDLGHAHLTGADLSGADLRRADLAHARFDGARLARADLAHARLRRADLRRARLAHARLVDADLTGADLTGGDLTGADLTGADLSGIRLVGTNLEGSTLDGCRVYGATVWNVRLGGASQVGLHIGQESEPEITVDDLELAQFVYLLLNNAKLRNVIDTVTAKAVLLLGRFTPERKAVLDALHTELRRRGYLPILFDFDRPSRRDTTETVLTLAGMARFVIADLTDAASVQQELSAIAYSALTSVPVQPVLLRGSREWSMFVDLQGKAAILPPYAYDSPAELLAELPERVIDPAEREAEVLRAAREQREAEAAARRRAQ